MKKRLLLTSLLVASNSFAEELHNFNEINVAVVSGKTIHIAIDLSKCTSSKKEMVNAMNISVFTPSSIQVASDHIATSLMHFTLDNPNFLGKSVYEYIRYKITHDNNVNLTAQILDPINYTPVSDKFSFNCKIDTAAKFYI